MRGITYTTLTAATTANESLSVLNHKPIEYIGEGPFIEPTPKPYTNIIKHPTLKKWALISTEEIETFLGKSSIELDSTWFTEEI